MLPDMPAVVPTPDLSREELEELVRRAMTSESEDETMAYHELLRVKGASRAVGLIYWPPDWDAATATWGGGRSMSEYDPEAADIVTWMSADPTSV